MKKKLLSPRMVGKGKLGSLCFLILICNAAALADKLHPKFMVNCTEKVADKSVSGLVTDEKSNPIPGVNVVLAGSTKGVTTDTEGRYRLDVPDENATLVFSSVGFLRQELKVGNRSVVNATMIPDDKALDEVVVVGYGTQKKANLTGSVATVGAEELTKRTATNAQNLLQGKVAGLQVIQSSGKPGDDNAGLRIRGLGTFSGAGSAPLVLINGVQGDMSNLAPSDIESVTVLKDAASSAIYGARAANGVILVTTKRGTSGQLSVELNSFVESQQASILPKLLTNSADYMQYWNDAKIRAGQQPYFLQNDIDAFRNSNDPVKYPNYNWIKNEFHTATAFNNNLSISGGNEKTTANLSLGYLSQGGIVSVYDFKRYNVLFSLDNKVNKWLTIGGTAQMVKKDIQQSNYNEVDGYDILGVYGAAPNFTPTMTLPDGSTGYVARYSRSIADWTVRNPQALDASGFKKINNYSINTQLYAEVKLLKNLVWTTKGAFNLDSYFNKLRETPINNYFFQDGSYAHNNATWHLGATDTYSSNSLTTLYSTLNYTKTIGNSHYFNVLMGYNQESNYYRKLTGSRINFPSNSISELDAAGAAGQSTSGTANEWAIRSFFARLAYDYKSKYLFEANARYDGTSRIAPSTRWGLFPSMSAAWRISEEEFAKDAHWLSNLKLRGSYGKLGNQNVGNYPYQDLLTPTSYPFGALSPAVQLTRLVDKNLRWESTTMTDFGIDLSLFKGAFSLTADWFKKVTDGILYQIPVPASIGLAAPTVNYGKMQNVGWEMEVSHNHTIGQLKYGVSLNFTTVANKVLDVLTPSYGTVTVQKGLPFNSFYLIEQQGIFQNQAEIDAAPKHQFNPKPGDLRFRDANNDGKIDASDRVVVKGAYPKFYYGGSVNLAWNRFDLSAFFQGVQGQKFYDQGGWGTLPYTQGSAPTLDFVKNMWRGEGTSNTQPAMYFNGYAPVTGTASTFLLYDASYLRLKNLSIGYNFPVGILKKAGVRDLRIYINGGNLLTFTKYPSSDPERTTTAGIFSVYPQLKTFAVGIKIKI